MFTPEGYWSWSETVEASLTWTLEIAAATLTTELTAEKLEKSPYKAKQILHEKLVSSGRVENLAEARFALELLELWVLANYMDTYDAVLCSPDGRTLRCPPIVKAHGDAFDWWVWPLSNEKMSNGEAHNYFDAFRNGKFHMGHARSRFCAIDYETGTIKLKPNTVNLLESASYGHSGTKEETLLFVEQQIRPIVGWSICWNDNNVPNTRKELFDSLGFGELDWSAFEDSETDDQRTSIAQSHIIECILTAFPDGKKGATWPEVETKVGYSRRSIVRALKKNGLHSKWAKVGQSQ